MWLCRGQAAIWTGYPSVRPAAFERKTGVAVRHSNVRPVARGPGAPGAWVAGLRSPVDAKPAARGFGAWGTGQSLRAPPATQPPPPSLQITKKVVFLPQPATPMVYSARCGGEKRNVFCNGETTLSRDRTSPVAEGHPNSN